MIDRYGMLRNGLVGAWCPSLGANGYKLVDRSGLNNHGTLTNMGGQTNWQAAAINFDASNDYVGLGTLKALRFNDNPWSISGWIYPKSTSTWRTVISKWSGGSGSRQFSIIINGGFGPPTAGLSFFTNWLASGSLGTSALAVNQWYFFCATHFGAASNANNLFVFSPQRGVEAITRYGSGGGGVDPDFGTNEVWIGRGQDNTATFDGLIDDVRLYNRVLASSEMWLLASRRGVGLVPQRHRHAIVPAGSSFHLNVSGTWKKATTWIKVGGTWKQATPKIRVSGAYK